MKILAPTAWKEGACFREYGNTHGYEGKGAIREGGCQECSRSRRELEECCQYPLLAKQGGGDLKDEELIW